MASERDTSPTPPAHLAQLNSAFRKAVTADRSIVSGGSRPDRGKRGPYDGSYLSLPHLAHLVANRLAEIDPRNSWPENEVEKILNGKNDRALPPSAYERQVFLEALQQELDKCFDEARSVRSGFRAHPHEYVKGYLGSKSIPMPYRPFNFDPASIGFFKIVDWNRQRRLEPENVGKVEIVEWPDAQDWIDSGDLDPYLEDEARASRGSPCPTLLGYDEDTRETNNQQLILRVGYNEYYRHVAVRQYLRSHHEVYDSLLRRMYASESEGGLRNLIRRAPRSNIVINVTVMDREGDVMLLRRSPNTRVWNGFFQAGPHETMVWPNHPKQPERCFELASRALEEEVGLGEEHYKRIVFSWFGFYLAEASAYFFAHVATSLSKSQLTKLTQEAPSAFETDDVAWLTPTEENIKNVLDTWRDGPWNPGRDAAGRSFLPHTAVSLTQLHRILSQRMLPL